MLNFFNKRKDYIVKIIDLKNIDDPDFVEVKASNKKEAMLMVSDVLIKCPMFGFKSINEFTLECYKKNKGVLN